MVSYDVLHHILLGKCPKAIQFRIVHKTARITGKIFKTAVSGVCGSENYLLAKFSRTTVMIRKCFLVHGRSFNML